MQMDQQKTFYLGLKKSEQDVKKEMMILDCLYHLKQFHQIIWLGKLQTSLNSVQIQMKILWWESKTVRNHLEV